MRSVPAQWFEPSITTSPNPCAIRSTRRRMKAFSTISPSSASVWMSVRSRSCATSTTSTGALAPIRTITRRPDSMLTSPVNIPGSTAAMKISPSFGFEGRTISSFPRVTTKKGTSWSPGLTRTSPASTARARPSAATRRTCSGVRVGNICSKRSEVSREIAGSLAVSSIESSPASENTPRFARSDSRQGSRRRSAVPRSPTSRPGPAPRRSSVPPSRRRSVPGGGILSVRAPRANFFAAQSSFVQDHSSEKTYAPLGRHL